MGRPLKNASARFTGVVAGPETAGDAEIGGTFGDAPVSGKAHLAAGDNGARRVEGLDFAVGESRVSGDLTIGGDGLFAGELHVESPDLSKVAPLFLVEASGAVQADVTLSAADGMQSAVVSGAATDVTYESVRLETAKIDGRGQDLFNAPRLDGDFVLRNLRTGGLTIVSATGTAERHGEGTTIAAQAELADGQAALRANLAPQDGGLAIGLERFSFTRNGLDLALASPTTVTVAGGGAKFDNATLKAGGGSATISGQAGQTLDLAVALSSIPAGLVNTFSPGLGAEGTVSGKVTVSGTAAAPVAQFDMTMSGASVAAARNAGVGPLSVAAQGGLANGSVKLTSRLSGADGMAVNVNGTVGTAGGAPLDFAITGAVPLSLGNRRLASRGAALRGALNVDIKISGTAASPQFAGRVTSEGGGFVDPESGIVLSDLSLVANVSNNKLVIERLNAKSGEGAVSVDGSLGLDPNQGLPVDMRVKINKARYVNGTLIAATFDADLALSGKLGSNAALSGKVTVDRAEITVPEQLPSGSVAVSVEHVDPPPPVERTLEVMREREQRRQAVGGGSSDISLDISVNAPQRIFVRGRGLDAELGGKVRLFGSTSSILASGSFALIRGRLDILTKRITLSRGVITFAGDLDPILDFVGTTTSGDTTITVTISGRASNPEVNFSSVPAAAAGRGAGAAHLPERHRRAVAAAGGAACLGGVIAGGRRRRPAEPAPRHHRARRSRHRGGRPGAGGAGGRPLYQRKRLCRRAAGRDGGIEPRHHRPRHHQAPEGARRLFGGGRVEPRRVFRKGILRRRRLSGCSRVPADRKWPGKPGFVRPEGCSAH